MNNIPLAAATLSDGQRLPGSALALLALLSLSGCMSMSGLSGSSSYACKAPDGVTCESVSGTYANAVQNNLPTQRRPAAPAPNPAPGARATGGRVSPMASGAAGGSMRTALAPSTTASPSSIPIRSSARILRLWFKPWEDADRDLHDQGYVYVRVDDGHWLVEHAQRQIREAYAPLRPPARAAGIATEPRDASSASQRHRPAGALFLPGLTPPPGRPPMSVDPANSD